MPVIRSRRQTPEDQRRSGLVDELARELLGEGDQIESRPVIFELPREVLVVWEKWHEVPLRDRPAMILEACQKFDERASKEEPLSPRITLTMGVTPIEAMDMNLLPFSVEASVYRGHPRYEAVEQEKIKEGAIKTAAGWELRFPSRELADEACEHLRRETAGTMPEVLWQVAKEVGRLL